MAYPCIKFRGVECIGCGECSDNYDDDYDYDEDQEEEDE